jgi:hypothetical protein
MYRLYNKSRKNPIPYKIYFANHHGFNLKDKHRPDLTGFENLSGLREL